MKIMEMKDSYYDTLKHYGLSRSHLTDVRLLSYPRGEFICMEGQPLSYMYIVVTGKAKVYCTIENGKSHLLCFYRSGGTIGELELMADRNHAQSTVEAITDLLCIAIPIGTNKAYLRSNVDFLNSVGHILARKLARSSNNTVHIILYPLETRLCSYIFIANQNGIFHEKLTETAELLGSSYRHLLRALNELVRDQVLIKVGHDYKIIDPVELKNRSKDFYEPLEHDMLFDFI